MSEPDDPNPQSSLQEDATYIHSRREAFMILGLWISSLVYTISYCYLNGYLSHEPLPSATGPDVAHLAGPLSSFNRDPASMTEPFGLGIPDWVFWGIVVPWLLCALFTFIFCLFVFAEDDLGTEPDTEPSES